MDVSSLAVRSNGETILASWFNSIRTLLGTVEGFVDETSTTFTNGQAATDLTGWTLDAASYTSGVYEIEVSRSTSSVDAFSNGRLYLQRVAGAWRVQTDSFVGDADASVGGGGLTFTVSEAGGIAQLRLATNTIAGTGHTGTIKWRRVVFNV